MMYFRKNLNHLLKTAVFLAVLLTLFTVRISAERTGSVSIAFPVEGTEFRLYKVGESNQDGSYALYEPYSSYQVDVEDKEAASLLAGYAVKDELTADMTVIVSEGTAVFRDLEDGVYLVLGSAATVGKMMYVPSPILFELPQWDQENHLIWDVEVKDKYESNDITEYTELSVVKIWKDNNSSARPDSITVTLTKDGKAEEEITLSKNNNWRYTWERLDDSYHWSVLEKSVPSGYKVGSSREGTTVYLTNTDSTPPPPEGPEIPPTGQLWWPVPVLLVGGLSLILIGVRRRRKAV